MESKTSKKTSLFMWVLVAGLLSQNLLIPVMCIRFEDQMTYYSPDPHAGTPSTGSHGSPPSHGSGGGTPPSHGTPSRPSHGSYNPTPSTPTPSHGSYNPTPSTPTPSHGSYNPTPSDPTPSTPSNPPSDRNCGTPPYNPTPSTPSNPPSGGGGYYYSPPTSGGGSPPTPIIVSPPTTPIDPATPGISVPTPPLFPAPFPPITGTCNYWRTHAGLIWGLLGWWGTLGNTFGVSSTPGFGANMNLLQALSNTRTDGLGALYREGTASWLNSMVDSRFPFTTKQVRDNFVAALGSNRAAKAQARLFKLANEGRLKPRA